MNKLFYSLLLLFKLMEIILEISNKFQILEKIQLNYFLLKILI